MEEEKDIVLLYHNREINLKLPSTYQEFIKIIEDKLYLTPELIKNGTIYYYDSDEDKNTLIEEEYNQCFEDNNGKFELEIDFFFKRNNDEEDNEKKNDKFDDKDNKNNINKKIDKNEIKNLEQKIANKYSKIFKQKLKEKDTEYQNEISAIKKDFEETMNSVIENNKNQFNLLSEYYNTKMKENFKKYNDMVIEKINKGLSQSNLNQLAEQFINNNQFSDINNDEENKDNNENLEFSAFIK